MARNDEAKIQASIVQWVRLVAPNCLIYAIANGGLRSKREAALLKWTGVQAGVPDLAIVSDGRACCLEVKKGKSRLSEAQASIIARLQEIGAGVAVVRSIDDAREAFEAWGIESKEAKP
ncbi:MAG: VRR-NUC domain-containing protein [Hyphomicrobiales bacterium]|nr:VRR-NUC domain-containing protein [Hyphomicrobiales bacterium]MDE2114071.1 VRR-NUC domain-containing protein [Hyphomicrobiales bacterium]